MPPLNIRLGNLSGAPRVAQVAILREALRYADPDERVAIAVRLIRLGSSSGVAASVRLIDRHPELREHVRAADPGVLVAAITQIVADGHARSIARSIEIIHTHSNPALALPLLPVLVSDDPDLRDAVAAEILNTTVAVIGPTGRSASSAASADDLDQLITSALQTHHRHRCADVLIAAGLLHNRAGPALTATLEPTGTPARLAVQGIPRHHDRVIVRQNLVRWMNSALLGRQVGRALHEINQPRAVGELLATMHLLLCPARRRMMRHVDHPARCLPELSVLEQLSDDAQRHLPRFVASLPITASRRVTYCADLIAAPSSTARWRAIEVLQGYRSDDAQHGVHRFARDREPVVAGVAATHVLRNDAPDPQLLHRIAGSCGHAVSSVRAQVRLAGIDPSALIAQITTLTNPALLAAAHRLAATQPQALVRQLQTLLQPEYRDVCLPAIFIIRRLGIVSSFVDALQRLTAADDPTICSAAVSAIAEMASPDAAPMLTSMLRHRHMRVRANAIDGLSAASRRHLPSQPAERMIEVVLPHTFSRHNRERANALRAWLQSGSTRSAGPDQSDRAADGLRDMLRDPNPMHRISAIWVAGRSRQRCFVDDLTELTRDEIADPVRHRAASALHRLTARPVVLAA